MIDLLASGHAEAIMRALGYAWHIPVEVQSEVQYVRQPDSDDPARLVRVAADLTPLIGGGVLTLCKPENQQEADTFVQYAAEFRSDGEAMCLALAESRGWMIATDDRKAIRISKQAGLVVISCPEILKTWVDLTHPTKQTLVKALKDIELLAQFRPNPSMPAYQWWLDQLRTI